MKGENGVKSSENLDSNVIANEAEAAVAEEKAEELAQENFSELTQENSAEIVEHANKPKKSSESFEVMLTTVDNPFDPFDQFDDWFRYDEEKGFHTSSYLGRIVQTDDEMSDEEFRKAIEQAVDEILKYDFMNIYKKVKRPVEDDEAPQKEAPLELG